ncbi:mechanosensitive ion channel family protein [Ramlibacter tataouinensis]|uniref:Candidate small conductance mechanosensitive ion n=1 Tax=Ramlibacter tataouinensis (strain ATCC BAA-407 / DSM 14655 / LMG 21543 / TTB310) TaxID=365046 RepID=F5Y4D5_RAMTT|nr:mechanosensitive ion channel family protein [Ramlibacter tataouinensis]AEG93782.1 Candidate small conductance mechanosensitive ion [Ramlibacter tataouinensis TTB310]
MVPELLQNRPWTAIALLALLAVLGAIVLHHAGRAVLGRASRGAPVIHSVLSAVDKPAGAALPLIALQVVWQIAPNSLELIDGVRHVNALLLIAALTWWLMSLISGFAEGVIAHHPVTEEDNLQARRIHTQARVLSRSAQSVVLVAGAAMALMTFPGARQVGASLLASAGVLGIVAGLAARPVFANLISGLQLALAQPIRLDDVLIVKGEWGRVEEITGTYVVLRIWDDRRMIIPLQWFIENTFENWTRNTSQLLGLVVLHLDYTTPMDVLRGQARKVVEAAPEWDKRVFAVQVQEATERAMQVRVLVSAANAGKLWDLRCRVREDLLTFLAREYPHCLPRVRTETDDDAAGGSRGAQAEG